MNLTTCALFFRLFPVWPFFIWEAKIIIYILYSYNHHYFYSKYSHEKIVVRVRRNTFLSRIIHDIQSIKWGLHSPQLVRSSSKFWNTFMPYVHRVHYRCVRSSSKTIFSILIGLCSKISSGSLKSFAPKRARLSSSGNLRSSHWDYFRKYLFFSSRNIFFWIFPGGFLFTEQIPIFQEPILWVHRTDSDFPGSLFRISTNR